MQVGDPGTAFTVFTHIDNWSFPCSSPRVTAPCFR